MSESKYLLWGVILVPQTLTQGDLRKPFENGKIGSTDRGWRPVTDVIRVGKRKTKSKHGTRQDK